MNLSRLIIGIAIVSASVVGWASSTYAGFGVSPGQIQEDKLVPGALMEKTIYLVQGTPTEDLPIRVSVESPNIQDWITIPDGPDQVIPAGQQQFPVRLSIHVPEDASLGIYRAFVRVTTIPPKAEGSQITIALGAKVTVDLTVGDDVVSEFSVKSIKIQDIHERQDPRVSVTIVNTGNVPAAPENASFELFNKYGQIRLAYAENDDFEETPPFQERTIDLRFPLDVRLGIGEYWGHVKIYDDGIVVKELKTIFNVTERTWLERYMYALIGSGIGIIILLLIIVGYLARKRA